MVKDVLENHLEKMISTGFNAINALSVRDKNSQVITKEIAGKDATLVCDPVILYGYKSEINGFTPSYKDYIVLYSYDKNMNEKEEYEKIREYAKSKNLRIVSVGYYHKWCQNVQATPEELLGWINNAALVVTDTFHGAVLSLICNTPMAVKVRGNKNKLAFLLEEYGLSNRIMEKMDDIDIVAERDIDFNIVNQIMEERRNVSMEFLDNALKG